MRQDDIRKAHLALLAQVTEHIEKAGQSVIGVFGGGATEPTFSYTIGNTAKGLPELLIFGLHPEEARGVLNMFGRMMRTRAEAFGNMERVSLGEGALPVLMVETDERGTDEYARQARVYFGDQDVSVVQVVIPDRQGRFPGQPGCEEPYASIPVINRDYPDLIAVLNAAPAPPKH